MYLRKLKKTIVYSLYDANVTMIIYKNTKQTLLAHLTHIVFRQYNITQIPRTFQTMENKLKNKHESQLVETVEMRVIHPMAPAKTIRKAFQNMFKTFQKFNIF